MSVFSQNRLPSTGVQDTRIATQIWEEQASPAWDSLEAQGEFLAGFGEMDESEFGLLAAAHGRIGGIFDKAADPSSRPTDDVLQGLASVQITIEELTLELRRSGRAPGTLTQAELDGSFREDPNSAYSRATQALLSFVDWYNTSVDRGGRASFRTDEHQAGDAAMNQILGVLGESYDHVYAEVAVGSPVVPSEMNVSKRIETERSDLVGKVAYVERQRFIHHSGQLARAADVHMYIAQPGASTGRSRI